MKIDSIQYLRAYAAILVVLNHVWGTGNISNILGFHHIGGFGVDIFFIISGFIMCFSLKNNYNEKFKMSFDFICRRIIRIYPPFLVMLIPFTIIYFIKCFYLEIAIVPIYVIKNILLLPTFNSDPNYYMFLNVSWTLVYEMFFYLIFSLAIIFTWSKKSTIILFSTIIFGLLLIVNYLGIQGERLNWVNFSYMVGDAILINFIIGSFIYLFFEKINKINFNAIFSLISIVLLTVLAMKLSTWEYSRFISFSIPATFVVLITLLTRCGENKNLILLGTASYSIYLVHMLFAIASKFISKFIDPDISGLMFSILAIISGVTFYKKIEDPLTKWCAKKYKKLKRN